MNILVDMNLSPAWVSVLGRAGHSAKHRSAIGKAGASDREIPSWALQNRHVVFTHDLDFGAILAATDADSPSVLQIRTQEPTPDQCAPVVVDVLARYAAELRSGALISIDQNRARVHLLPLRETRE
jgi:predicted nuclease of predicted toxin-antitoxin system